MTTETVNKNLLRGTKCYLAGNLEYENWESSISWRESIKKDLALMDIIALSPLDKVFKNFEQEQLGLHTKLHKLLEQGDLRAVHNQMKSIRRRDLAMVDFCNFIICVFNAGKPTVGTVEELAIGLRANKKIFVVIPQGLSKIPLWLIGMLKPECFYNSLNEVLNHLKKIDSGESPITEENWRIFEDLYL